VSFHWERKGKKKRRDRRKGGGFTGSDSLPGGRGSCSEDIVAIGNFGLIRGVNIGEGMLISATKKGELL